MNGLEIDKDTFMNMPPDNQREVFFDYLAAIYRRSCLQHEECDARFACLEKRKWWNTAASGGGGLIGGFITMVGYLKFWK